MFTKVFSVFLVTMMTVGGFIQPVQAHDVFEVDCDEDGVYFTVNYDWLVDDDVTNTAADFHVIQDAINAASAGDRIMVCPGTYYENLWVGKDLSIYGADANPSAQVIDGNAAGSVAIVALTVDVDLHNMTMQHGDDVYGGAIVYMGDSLYLDNMIVMNNEAQDGGGIYGWSTAGDITIHDSLFDTNEAVGTLGGAIAHENWTSTIIIDSSTFQSNEAKQIGGAIMTRGNLDIDDSFFLANQADSTGGVWAQGSWLEVDNSDFNFNIAWDAGAGALGAHTTVATIASSSFQFNAAYDVSSDGTRSGALYSSADTTNITDSTFAYNLSEGEGGAVSINNALYATVEGSTFAGNDTDFNGGAVFITGYQLTISEIAENTFVDNTAVGDGGAISVGGSTAHMTDNTFEDNVAGADGGAIDAMTSVELLVENNFFGSNTAEDGGAVYTQTGGPDFVPGVDYFTNNTFFDNQATRYGGAITTPRMDVERYVEFNTFYQNTAATHGGAIAYLGGSSLTTYFHLLGNIFADNTVAGVDDSCYKVSQYVSYGYNAVTNGSDCNLTHATDLLSASPGFATTTPQNNGGDTDTLALSASSALVDAGSCTMIDGSTLTEDQRHYARPSGATCDIGAYEY